jgi:hypothetical protein
LDFTEKMIREALKIVGKAKLDIANKDGSVTEVDFSGE